MTHKAIVINKWWAGVFAVLATTSAVSTFKFAWDANSQQAVTQSEVQTLKEQQRALQNVPERLARVEQTVEGTDKTVDSINRKIDILVQNQMQNNLKPAR